MGRAMEDYSIPTLSMQVSEDVGTSLSLKAAENNAKPVCTCSLEDGVFSHLLHSIMIIVFP